MNETFKKKLMDPSCFDSIRYFIHEMDDISGILFDVFEINPDLAVQIYLTSESNKEIVSGLKERLKDISANIKTYNRPSQANFVASAAIAAHHVKLPVARDNIINCRTYNTLPRQRP